MVGRDELFERAVLLLNRLGYHTALRVLEAIDRSATTIVRRQPAVPPARTPRLHHRVLAGGIAVPKRSGQRSQEAGSRVKDQAGRLHRP